jgi:hypothetical protein
VRDYETVNYQKGPLCLACLPPASLASVQVTLTPADAHRCIYSILQHLPISSTHRHDLSAARTPRLPLREPVKLGLLEATVRYRAYTTVPRPASAW